MAAFTYAARSLWYWEGLLCQMMALKLSGLSSWDVSQLGFASESTTDGAVWVSTARGRKQKAATTRVSGLQWPEDGTSQRTGSTQEHLWRRFFKDPTQWWDNRRNKRDPKEPDFRHAKTLQVLWIDNQYKPAWVQAMLSSLENPKAGLGRAHWAPVHEEAIPAVASSLDHVTVEGLWQNHFNHPSDWWDIRDRQFHRKLPDFGLKGAKEALWLQSRNSSQWDINGKTSSEKPDGGSLERGTTTLDGECKTANAVAFRLPGLDIFSMTALISQHTKCGQGREALKIYEEMREAGVRLISHTFVAALKACSSLQDLESAKRVHADVVGSGFESDVYVGTMLLDVYAKCGSLIDARQVFERMPSRNVVSWNAMILGYAHMGEGEGALQLYRRMQQEGVLRDDRTFVGALKACSSLAAWEVGRNMDGNLVKVICLEQVRAIHLDILKSGSGLDLFLRTMLVDVYAKCGSLVDARGVFEEMPNRDVVSWNAMILGYAQMEQGEEALRLYERMQQEGVAPDDRTFVGALKACGIVAGLKKGKEVHAQIAQTGLEATDSFVASSLIDMYAKCGSMVDAQRVFDSLPSRNIVTWSALIAGYARQGKSDIVFDLFRRMRQQGIQPNGVTFLSVLAVCSHGGLVDQGQKYFAAMSTDFGITPTIEHYTCMVDLFGRAGKVESAMAMAKAIPFQPDGALWESVLGACRKWGNVELGREAFECAVRLDSSSPAAYVLMSNIYASARMWDSMKEIQDMRDKTLGWEQPGQSSFTDIIPTVQASTIMDDQEHQDTYARAKKHVSDKMKDNEIESLLSSVLQGIPGRVDGFSGSAQNSSSRALSAV